MCWRDEFERNVGYWLGRAYWGRGYASRALALLLDEVTDRPLIAHVADDQHRLAAGPRALRLHARRRGRGGRRPGVDLPARLTVGGAGGSTALPAVSLRLVTDQPAQPPQPAAPTDPNADPTPPRRPSPTGPVQYKGDDLEAERGPGPRLLPDPGRRPRRFIILTPLSVAWNWPPAVSAVLLFAVILLLLVTGQTIIFLLRLVAADRRGRRRPLASSPPDGRRARGRGAPTADEPTTIDPADDRG